VARVGDPTALRGALADGDEAVRARAVLELPDDPPLFQDLALKDPSALVRRNACGRLLDPATLNRIIRNDGSAAVRLAAMGRLTDAKTLEAYLADGPDWQLRAQAATKISDPDLLARAAASDPDEDVREAARDRLYHLGALANVTDEAMREAWWKASVEPPPLVRRDDLLPADPAIRRSAEETLAMKDRAAIRASLRDGSPEVRRAAAFRLLELEGRITDPRAIRLYLTVSDPALEARFGPLRPEISIATSEQRYATDSPGGGYPPLRGRVITERLRIRITTEEGRPMAEREYAGARGKKAQAFDQRYPMVDGSYILYNPAKVNLVEICLALLQQADRQLWEALAASGDKYLRAVAMALLHP
jgi:hypothetical protein